MKIETAGNINLEVNLKAGLKAGRYAEFSNGCSLNLKDDHGTHWGSTPYGTDWACDAGAGAIQSIKDWLAYWNEDRDENGNLMR